MRSFGGMESRPDGPASRVGRVVDCRWDRPGRPGSKVVRDGFGRICGF